MITSTSSLSYLLNHSHCLGCSSLFKLGYYITMMLTKHASHITTGKLIKNAKVWGTHVYLWEKKKNAKVCQGLNMHISAFALIKPSQYQGHLSNIWVVCFFFLPPKNHKCSVMEVEREGNLKRFELNASSAIDWST